LTLAGWIAVFPGLAILLTVLGIQPARGQAARSARSALAAADV